MNYCNSPIGTSNLVWGAASGNRRVRAGEGKTRRTRRILSWKGDYCLNWVVFLVVFRSAKVAYSVAFGEQTTTIA